MSVEDHFRQAYEQGSTPWDVGKADFNLVHAVTTMPIAACKALDIGCGTGDNAIWLSEQNFTVVGVDSSEIAVDKAREKTAHANLTCTFAVVDFLRSHVEGAPFGFAFDRIRQRNYRIDRSGDWGYRLLSAQAAGVSSASR